jgi:3-isopropylmalate/(R)-2-methylmalate dehydratase small subunit
MSRVWKFGDNVDTDLLAPGLYMKGPVEELARHCLEALEPQFAGEVKAGDIIVAGKNFGMGSSREQAAQVLRMLGVQAVLAKSFGGIFYRNAFNLGLLALVCADVDSIDADDELQIDARSGRIGNLTSGEQISAGAIPEHLLQLIEAGGLVAYLEQRSH